MDDTLNRLASSRAWGYHASAAAATEPTALAALALFAHNRFDAARRPIDWLIEQQQSNGALGVTATETAPNWPTSLAVLAWTTARDHAKRASASSYESAVDRAINWLLEAKGLSADPTPDAGHDPTLVGWPWVIGTHSWVEPTALSVLALKRMGYGNHARTREAVRMLVDRLLPDGGCNYGNTVMLGQTLRSHVQPTGLALLALGGEQDATGRITRTLDYLQRELSSATTTASLSYGLLGLAAHGACPSGSSGYLASAAGRTLAGDASAYNLSLLALAAARDSDPLGVRQQARLIHP